MIKEKRQFSNDPPQIPKGNYLHFVLDQLAEVENLSFKKAFGGVAFYLDGHMVGAITGGKFRLKAVGNCSEKGDSSKLTTPNIEGEEKIGKYFEVPEAVLLDKNRLKRWVDVAYREALKTKN